jgi:predicted RNase H-like HicB family nuclease
MINMNSVYPVVFTPEDDGTFCVYAPDLPGCVTEADDYADGVSKIREGICGILFTMQRNNIALPEPSAPHSIALEAGDVVALVDADVTAYAKRVGSKAVRRTISIPEWMDIMATSAGVSLSQITQDALRQILNV